MSWDDLLHFRNFSDVTAYFVMAIIGTLFFLLRLIMTLIGGVDADADFDTDMEGGVEAHGADFSLFSLLSIVSFLMGAGWMGLACRLRWDFSSAAAFVSALGFGGFLMFISSWGMWQMRKMNVSGNYNARSAIGQVGKVYLRVPARGDGEGQVQIDVDGTTRTLPAVSSGPPIDSFTVIRILDVLHGDTLIVEPA